MDVVIPCAEKDLPTLELCIRGASRLPETGRLIVVSPWRMTDAAEWFDEARFPFSKDDVASEVVIGGDPRLGWYLQQLIKLYASFVIDGISEDILVIDADTVFLRPVRFVDWRGRGLYATGTEHHPPYFAHMQRLLPGLRRETAAASGIVHHMLLRRSVLLDLFARVESLHRKEFWRAFLNCVDDDAYHSGASEYEIYFNFAQRWRGESVRIRPLRWRNALRLADLEVDRRAQYHYVSYHAHERVA
jgi:hypothetical protein